MGGGTDRGKRGQRGRGGKTEGWGGRQIGRKGCILALWAILFTYMNYL